MIKTRTLSLFACALTAALPFSLAAAPQKQTGSGKPLKIYILAGQSNMQGQAQPGTVPRMALSPESKPLHDQMLDASGKSIAHENVSIVYFTQGDEKRGKIRPLIEKKGQLAVGTTGAIGPELGFGITMDEAGDQPILIIKTAWGGKNLNVNFRPPSAGLMPFNPPSGGRRSKAPSEQELKEMKAEFEAEQGAYYRLMMKLINRVITDPGQYSEAYDPELGHEIAGFVWFQGYNDMIQSSNYDAQYSKYSELLATFIRDVRKDLESPKLPFVIGVMGIGGESSNPKMEAFRKAMAKPAALPEFQGNVAAVKTAVYWDEEMIEAIAKVKRAEELWDSSEHWIPAGSPAPDQRIWQYSSFQLDPDKHYRDLKKGEEGDERTLTGETPESLAKWLDPDFDTSAWQQGPAPIGKIRKPEKFKRDKHREEHERLKAMIRSPWGEGNILLMKTQFEIGRDDLSDFRLALQSTRSFLVYLNGELIQNYPWWKDEEMRRLPLDSPPIKPGINELAFYGNIEEYRGKLFNAVDLHLEALPKERADELRKQQAAIATPRDFALAKGVSNQAYHYLGSAYTYTLIGEAMAKAMLDLD
ncbi:MAG: sialate O-acetylesterase [Akkermansiaceae bacterium]|nr:sialate O-acetylesterase [Akkermansiaceae bacterium]